MSEHAEPDLSNSRSFIDEQSSPYDHDYPKIELSHESTMTDSFSESESSPVKQYHSTLATESRTMVNKYLRIAGETPITKRKLQSKKYKKSKLQTVLKMMEMVGIDEKPNEDDEIISQLKELFHSIKK